MGEWYLKSKQQELNHRLLLSLPDVFRQSCLNRYLCNNKANLLTCLGSCCTKITGTSPVMTINQIICLIEEYRLIFLDYRGSSLKLTRKNDVKCGGATPE